MRPILKKMIRQLIAFAFVLLANTLIIAFVIVPHHHHNAVACLETSHCEDDQEEPDHCGEEHKHDHQTNPNESPCVLESLQVVTLNSVQYEDIISDHLQTCMLNHLDLNLDVSENLDELQLNSHFHPAKSLFNYPDYITKVNGLRAPPNV